MSDLDLVFAEEEYDSGGGTPVVSMWTCDSVRHVSVRHVV